jgi:hypothetical protein
LRAIITNSISFGPERWAGRANVSTAPNCGLHLANSGGMTHGVGMELDALLAHYFKTDDLASVDDVSLVLGCEQLALDFGVEQEGGRKFALWVVLDALGMAPCPPRRSRIILNWSNRPMIGNAPPIGRHATSPKPIG